MIHQRKLSYKLLCVVSNSWCKCIMTSQDPKDFWIYKNGEDYICKKEGGDLEKVRTLVDLANLLKEN